MPSLNSILGVVSQVARKLGPRGPSERGLERRVIRGIDAVRCCEQGRVAAYGRVVGIVNEILALLPKADGHNSLSLVPIGGTLAYRVVVAVATSEASLAAAATAAAPGAILLLSALEFYALGQQKGVYDAISMFNSAIAAVQTAELQSIRRRIATQRGLTDCERCVNKRLLSQSHRRKKMTAKINRRL